MAANWLRNIQGQLSEFATEVLNEAQNEVPDPESELQVEKKKSVEFERLLHAEKTRTEELTAQNKNLEEQLYSTNMEMDAISIRFQNMVESRDQQIKTLKSEVEQLRHQCEEGGSSDAPADFQNQMKKLKAEVNHWKRIVKESDTGGYQLKVRELEQKLEEQRNKQQDEISALMELHQQNLAEEREHYEAKLAETQEPDSYDAQLKERVEELKQTIEDIRMNHVAEMSDLASKHGREIRDLQSQLEASEDAKELQERVLLLTDEVEEWRQKMEDEHIKHVEEMTALSEKHRDEIRNLQSQLAAAEDGWNCESSGLSFNSENSGNLEKEMPRLKEEVSMLEREDREDVERAAQTDDESWYASDEDEKNRLQMENAKLYDDMKTLSQKCSELEKRHEEEVARLEQDLSEKHEELLLKNIQLEQARKNAEIKVAMAQMDAGAIEEESQQLKTEIERMKLEHRLVEAQPDNPSDVSAQECARLRAVLEGIEEENKRLFEFIDGKIPKSTTADTAMSSEELDSKLGCQDVKSITDKDAEIRRLRMEVFEMLKAYNELNDDFNDFKERQANDDSNSAHRDFTDLFEMLKAYNELNDDFNDFKERQANDDSNSAHRDFTDRIDSLKASLIEYEERYEQCKRENSETVAQLERLNADFEKLRYGMSCAASCSKKTDETLVAENKQLKELLKESMDDKDKLIADAHKFQTTVSSIDKELGNLRESNRSLHSENASLRETLNGSRDRVSETSALLGDMRSELSSIRDASRSREETLGGRIAQLEAEKEELEKEVELLRIKALENDTSLARYRAVVGHDGANIVEMNQEHSAKGSASEGSNNDWERTGGEWTTDQPLSSSSSEQRRPSTSSDPEPSSLSPTARKVDVERLEEKLEHALAEIAALSEQKNELEVSNADLSSTVENLNQTVDNIKASFDSLSSNLESMKMEHSQLIVERDNLLRKIEEQEVQLEEQKVLQSKVVASDAEIGQLKSFAEELEKQNKEQTNALEEFRTITENLKEEQSKTCSERDSLAGEVN
uniref:GOLGA2L5 domain-containing protein n=1 Tax=Steinernema glaseri TaxID=37863 RepID=A0A1I7Y3X8_9BILA